MTWIEFIRQFIDSSELFVAFFVSFLRLLHRMHLDLVSDSPNADGFGVEFVDVEVKFDSIVVRLVDATPDGIVVHLHQELTQSASSSLDGRRR